MPGMKGKVSVGGMCIIERLHVRIRDWKVLAHCGVLAADTVGCLMNWLDQLSRHIPTLKAYTNNINLVN